MVPASYADLYHVPATAACSATHDARHSVLSLRLWTNDPTLPLLGGIVSHIATDHLGCLYITARGLVRSSVSFAVPSRFFISAQRSSSALLGRGCFHPSILTCLHLWLRPRYYSNVSRAFSFCFIISLINFFFFIRFIHAIVAHILLCEPIPTSHSALRLDSQAGAATLVRDSSRVQQDVRMTKNQAVRTLFPLRFA